MIRKMLEIHSKNRMKLGEIVKKIEHENSLLDQTDETENIHSNLIQEKTSGRSIEQLSKPNEGSKLIVNPHPQFSHPN